MGSQLPQIPQLLNMLIVLVAIYATLSCVCSWVQERIASALALRGWGLFRGIAQLTNEALATAVFNHPIVASSSPNPNRKVSSTTSNAAMRFLNVAWSRPPSYLDARNFSSAFWQELAAAHLPGLPTMVATAIPGVAAATDTAEALSQLVVGAPTSALKHLENAVRSSATMPSNLRKQSLALLSAAENDYTNLLAATDGWFNAQMDRASGWYKRQTQWIVFLIAVLVVSFSGVDTLDILKVLSATDPCTLAQYAHEASSLADKNGSQESTVPADCKSKGTLPGFNVTIFAHPSANVISTWAFHDEKQYWRWPGLLLTLIALTLGGPFWFDVLKSLINVRSAGRKPERGDQPPK